MNTRFTSAEIARASQLVKQARAAAPVNVDAAISSLMGPGSYDAWLGPKSIIEPNPPPRPGFWASLGRSALGAADKAVGPVRGFFGLAPGQSGLRTMAQAVPHWAWGKITGDTDQANRAAELMRQGLVIPTQNAYAQSNPYHMALSDWASREHPTMTSAVTQPIKTFKDWWNQPMTAPKRITPPTPAWKERPPVKMPKPTW